MHELYGHMRVHALCGQSRTVDCGGKGMPRTTLHTELTRSTHTPHAADPNTAGGPPSAEYAIGGCSAHDSAEAMGTGASQAKSNNIVGGWVGRWVGMGAHMCVRERVSAGAYEYKHRCIDYMRYK